TGWYVWGMHVPAKTPLDAYGVKILGGPQVFLTARFRSNHGRAFATYLKFATVQDSGGFFSTQNRELAIGGAYQLSKPEENKGRWMLTADVSQVKFENVAGFKFSFNTYNLGISRGF